MNPLWNEIASRANVSLNPKQHQLLSSYLDRLLAANETMNLTRITERAAAELQHVGDALTVLPFIPPGPLKLADVGTGGGVPGIPLAIARPEIQVVLIESTRKKAVFLESAVQELGLANVKVLGQRAAQVRR